MNKESKSRDCIAIGIVGIAIAICGGVLPIGFREALLSHDEAWKLGIAQLYVFFGVALTLLSLLAYRGYSWVRWPIVFWGPATIVTTGVWAAHVGISPMTTFDLLPLSLLFAIWIYGAWKMMF